MTRLKSKEIITQTENSCHNLSKVNNSSQDNIIEHYQTLSPENVFNAYADWIREYEPFCWFATFTFKTDILSYSQNHPVYRRARYSWRDKTGKYPNGTYVRESERLAWSNSDEYERSGQYVNRVQEEHSEKMYKRWIRKLNTTIHGKRYRENKKGVFHIYAIEYQKRGVAHLHSLLKGLPDDGLNRMQWEKVWEEMHANNGFCNIFPYDPEKGAAGYLGKYILKGGHVTFDGPKLHSS